MGCSGVPDNEGQDCGDQPNGIQQGSLLTKLKRRLGQEQSWDAF